MRNHRIPSKQKVFECPDCGSTQVETKLAVDRFDYGSGDNIVELEALVPFRKCSNCGFEYTDYEAEDKRHEAICRHLGVMPPAEVVALRKQYDLSRVQFAEKTHIGVASLARWETGEIIQNAANDSYLFLLGFPDNMRRLETRYRVQPVRGAVVKVVDFVSRFRVLNGDRATLKREEAEEFSLRPAIG